MVLTLLLFQLLLEAEYWNQEKEFLMGDAQIPERVDTAILYSLYSFELLILTSVFIARHV